MMSLQEKVFLCLCVSFATFRTVYSINCYQCSGTDSNDPFQCNEFLENDVDLLPVDCATIHNAQYCIKHVGRYEGGISTKRYCSSLDLGNYCNYVQQPGDKLEYRTCIFTYVLNSNFIISTRKARIMHSASCMRTTVCKKRLIRHF
ncbi:hypothetical protein PYW07_001591 [Mythimna separata]|uniref:Protein sleepless n=1 Tax=Mythimna separata TaxID=271217 RepID=A0AAD8DW24_MYTSE|nr:hypothetical protein PYW07_001591 [Mythimna separata]